MAEHAQVTAQADLLKNVRDNIDNYDLVVEEARKAVEAEQSMTLLQGLRQYPKAVFWSVAMSTALVMEGYDIMLLGNFYAMPQFNAKYGNTVDPTTGAPLITAAWQAGLSNAVSCGEIIGLCINGWAAERFGYRKTYMAALVALSCFIFIPFFARSLTTLLIGELLQGMPWGVFQTLTTAYASEVTPVALRPYLTAYVNLCWVLGELISAGVLRGVLNWDSQWAYRLPFALQWVWPIPLFLCAYFAPESPWWEVRHGHMEGARRSIRRLNSYPTEEYIESQLSMMIHTNAIEKGMSEGTSYWDCFKGVDRRRTEITIMAWTIQNLCGSVLAGSSTYFLEQAGFPASNAFSLNLGEMAVAFAGTLGAWFLMQHVGRRRLYIVGLFAIFCLLITIGGLGSIAGTNNSALWAIGALLIVYFAFFDLTLGPVCYSLVGEISSTRLRAKTIVISRIVYNIVQIIDTVISPYMLNPTAWNWGAKSGFFWAGTNLLCQIWCWFRLPEAKGRTYGELDVLFENRVPAWKFSTTSADQFTDHNVEQVQDSVLQGDGYDEKFGSVQHVADA